MLIAACLIVAVTVILGVASVVTKNQRKNWMQESVVYLPFYLAGVGIVCGGIMSIPTVVCAMDGDWMFTFFGAVVLACDCMMVAYLNCVIRYDDKGFVARNFFGIRRSCSYAEVEGIRFGKDHRIYFQGHSIMLDEISIGRDEFIEAIDKGYKRATGKWVPSLKLKWDPMNGHLDHPWFYFCLWIFLGLLSIAGPILVSIAMLHEIDPSELCVSSVVFSKYEVDDDTLRLYVKDKETPFVIEYYEDYEDALPKPDVLCNGNTYLVGTEGGSHYVQSLTSPNGTQYITLETSKAIYRENQMLGIVLMLFMSPIGIVISYFAIAVARHPERYSDSVRRLFYKDGYLH